MQPAYKPNNEEERISALQNYEVLDTRAETSLDQITALASEICGAPISLISLVDTDRQWFKSKVGLEADETPRDLAFCAHAILEEDIFEIPDATKDPRFFDNPLVTEAPDIRFYAGAQLTTQEGLNIGTLCVIDQKPKVLSDSQKRLLNVLADQVIHQLDLKSRNRDLEALVKQRESMYATLSHDLKSPFNAILNLSTMIERQSTNLNDSKLMKLSGMLKTSAYSHYEWLTDLLQWSKFQLGEPPKLQRVCVSSVVSEITANYAAVMEQKGLELKEEVDNGLFITADENMLKSVLRNLIDNSIKFSPPSGQIVIVVSSKSAAQANIDTPSGDVIIEVIDQGPGINSAIADKLFKEFVPSQVGSQGELGTGIGLSLCGSMIQKMKGRIWVEKSAFGAHIRLCLPVAVSDGSGASEDRVA